MKKFIFSLALFLSLGVAGTFAAEVKEDPRVESMFARHFSGAENVTWSDLEDGMKRVTFTLGGIRTEAYYTADAELLGSARNLFFSQLPLAVMQSINNKYTGAVVIEVVEITNQAGTSYKMVLEQKEKKYTLRVNSIGEILEQQKKKMK